MDGLHERVVELLEAVQQALFDRALAFREENTVEASNYDELREAVDGKWVRAYWCGDPEDDDRLKADTSASSRCIPLDQEEGRGTCAICGRPATYKAVFARAY